MKALAPVLAVLAVVLVGCSPRKNPDPKVSDIHASAAAASQASEGAALPVGAAVAAKEAAALPVIGPAPAWKLRDVEGREVSSDSFKGKVVVLDFWATWCPPCRAEIPGYVDLSKKYGDRLVIVGVSLDEGGPKVVRDFVKKFGVTYPIVMGDDAIQQAYGGMEAIPTTFLIDQEGRIRDKKVGAEKTELYERKIAALLRS